VDCACATDGISCSQDACDCADDECCNPLRDRFEAEKVDKLRREKVERANQELLRSPSPLLQNFGALVRSGMKRTLNFLTGSPPPNEEEVPPPPLPSPHKPPS